MIRSRGNAALSSSEDAEGQYNVRVAETYPHIALAANGMPVIAGTSTKVVEIVIDQMAHHWDAEEIHRQHPYLSLAQICAALAYYHDHETELNREIEERLRREDDLIRGLGDSVLRAKLQAVRRGQSRA